MTWCAIILMCLLSEGIAPETRSTGATGPERLKAIAERLSKAPQELNRKNSSEAQKLVEDIISIAAIVKQDPELRERAAGVLTSVLQRETKRDASLDLKPWEKVQLAAALVLVKIEDKNAAGSLQALYERSRSPVVWARLKQQLAGLGIKDADNRLKSEERARREKLLAKATGTAKQRIGRASTTIRSLIKGQEVAIMSEEDKVRGWGWSWIGAGGFREMQWLVRDLGVLSVFVTKKQRAELAEQFVELLLVDDRPAWLWKWVVGVFGPEAQLQAMILREVRDMPADCPAFERLPKFVERDHEMDLNRSAALVLERWRIFTEIVGRIKADAGKEGDP